MSSPRNRRHLFEIGYTMLRATSGDSARTIGTTEQMSETSELTSQGGEKVKLPPLPTFDGMENLESQPGQESIDAYLERGDAKVRVRILFALMLCNACDAVETMSIGYLLPQLTEISDLYQTVLASAVFVGMTIGGIGAGLIASKVGRKKVLVYALLAEGIAALAGALMPNIELFIFMRMMTGLAIGATVPVLFILAPEVVAPTVRERHLTFITGSFAIGSVFIGLLAYASFEIFDMGWRLFYALTSIWPFATAVYTYMIVPESPVFLAKTGNTKELHDSLQTINPAAAAADIRNVQPDPGDFGMNETCVTRRAVDSFKAFFTEDLNMKYKLMGMSFVISWVWYGLSTWAVSLFTNLGVNSPYLSGLFFTVCGALGSIACIYFVNQSGMKLFMLFGFVVSTGSTFVSTFVTVTTLAVLLACVTNSAVGGVFNVVVSYQSVVPLSDRPLSMGVFGASMRVASILAQFVMGFASAADSQWIIHLSNATLLAVALAIAVSLPDVKPREEFLHSFYIARESGSLSHRVTFSPQSTVQQNVTRSTGRMDSQSSVQSVHGQL